MSDSGFGTTCEVVVGNTYNTTGTVTRSRIAVLSPSAIKALFTTGTGAAQTYNEMGSLYKHQIEMQMCGIRRSNLYDWLMSSNKRGQGSLINVQNIAKGGSLLEPFIRGLQKSQWNVDHWTVTANVAGDTYDGAGKTANLSDADTTAWGDTATGNRVLTVQSSFSGTMTLHADYFLPGKRVHVMSRGAGSALNITQFKIVQAAVHSDGADAGLKIDVEVTLDQPPKIAVTPGDATAGITADATVASGVLFLGVNNVHDIEAWCKNMVNVNRNKLVPFWYQTKRHARRVSERYEEVASLLMENNAYYAMFQDIPMTERNLQDEVRDRTEELNCFFFGERISIWQTLDKWGTAAPDGLERVKAIVSGGGVGQSTVNIGNTDELIAFRANMIGVVPQLADCGRVTDCAGQNFGLKSFFETDIRGIVRARRDAGRPSNEVDIWTDETSALEFIPAFMEYSKSIVGDVARINVEQGFTEWGFPFRKFRLYLPAGVCVNILTDDYFNDLATAAGNSLGRWLMVLDLGQGGSIYPAVLATNRKQHTIGDINDLAKIDKTFFCAMENPKERVTLTSKTMTAVVEDPLKSIVIANFAAIVSGVTIEPAP